MTLIKLPEGNDVRLRVLSLAIVFHIRRWNNYYSVVVRAADGAVFNPSSGLLVDGCTNQDYIDIAGVTANLRNYAFPVICRFVI